MTPLPRRARLRRLLGYPPRQVADVLVREASLRTVVRATETRLALAARAGRPIALGPFVGEIGYELLYWIPLLRRLLRRYGVPPDQVTAFTRGGAAVWYQDVADRAIEVFDLMPPDEFVSRLVAQRERAREAKLLRLGALEHDLLARAGSSLRGMTVIHPRLMYGRFRWAWAGSHSVKEVLDRIDQRPLVSPGHLPEAVAQALPHEFVAVKAYFSDVLPGTDADRRGLAQLLRRLAERADVVLLTGDRALDDHEEWAGDGGRVHQVGQLLDPRDNLAVQTEIVARARGLVATYGGFSYLGALLGIPTLALHTTDRHNPVHLEVLRATIDASYELVDLHDSGAPDRLLSHAREVGRT